MHNPTRPTFLFFFTAIAATLVAPAAFACGGYGPPSAHVVVAPVTGHHARRAKRARTRHNTVRHVTRYSNKLAWPVAKQQRRARKRLMAHGRHQKSWHKMQITHYRQHAKRGHQRALRPQRHAHVMQPQWQPRHKRARKRSRDTRSGERRRRRNM
mgnify:CR=1 FL=1